MEIPRIKCHVEDCTFCERMTNTCVLSSITIDTSKKKNKCAKEYTFCDSYQKMKLK